MHRAHWFDGVHQATSKKDRLLAREAQKDVELHLENVAANEKTLDAGSVNGAGVAGDEQVTMYVAARGRLRDCVHDRSARENSYVGPNV